MRARWLAVVRSQERQLVRIRPSARARIVDVVVVKQQCQRRWNSGSLADRAGTLSQLSGLSADEPSPQLSVEERRLLGRARLHGIHSLEQLEYEADLGHRSDRGSRLLDDPARRQDLDLWLFLLQHSRQSRGLDGVKAIWNGILHRGRKVLLETDNANARDIVDIFIYTGIAEDIDFLRQVIDQCIRRKHFVNELFVGVIGGLLRHRPEHAPGLVSLLLKPCYHGRGDLVQVFEAACESTQTDALKFFRIVADQTPERNIYHDIIPRLWELNRPADAFAFHQHLLSKNDRPQAFPILLPFVGYLAHAGQPLEPFLHGLQAAGIDYLNQPRRVHEREVRKAVQNLDTDKGFDPRSIAPEPRGRLQDETIARILATKAFSFDFLINGVHLLGTVELGPLAVRQLILASADFSILNARFDRLNELELDTGSSLYVVIIQRLRASRRWDLIKLIAESDMHHEEFADRKLQHRLLSGYLRKGSEKDAERTLVILCEGRTDHIAQEFALNLRLRNAAICHDWRKVLDIVVSLHRLDFRLKSEVLKQLIQMLQPRSIKDAHGLRSTFKGTPTFDVPSFLVGILQQLMATRTKVSPFNWLGPLVSLARHDRLDQVHKLGLFLAEHYTSRKRDFTADSSLNRLFTPMFQRAIVAWDFTVRRWRDTLSSKAVLSARRGSKNSAPTSPFSFKTKAPPSVPWLKGAHLLKTLRDRYNIPVNRQELEREYLYRLKRMAVAEGKWKVVSNKTAAQKCGYTYQDLITGWNELWYSDVEPLRKDAGIKTLGTVDPAEAVQSVEEIGSGSDAGLISDAADDFAKLSAMLDVNDRTPDKDGTGEIGQDSSSEDSGTPVNIFYSPSDEDSEVNSSRNRDDGGLARGMANFLHEVEDHGHAKRRRGTGSQERRKRSRFLTDRPAWARAKSEQNGSL
jgi:hypothetical protein